MPVECTCLRCGNVFLVPSSHVARGEGKFCSHACRRGYPGTRHEPRRGVPRDEDTLLVPLTQGQFAIIDRDDADRVLSHKWFFACGYALRALDNGRQVGMHALILGDCPTGMLPDHINGNRLDNRERNLRCATYGQNRANAKLSRNNTSGYRGVVRRKRSGKWRAQIVVNGKGRYSRSFRTPEEAARAYDDLAREAWGPFARLNFPDE